MARRANMRKSASSPATSRRGRRKRRVSAAAARGRRAPLGRGPAMNLSQLIANLPNLVTLARLLMTPLVVAMIVSQRFVEAFVVFVVAGASDAVDGFIARRFDLRTELGSYLDPLADKALLISIYVALATIGALAPALAILVVSRDLMIMFAVLVSWLLAKPVEIRPARISKLNTAAQIAFAAFVLGAKAFGVDGSVVQPGFTLLVAASTLASGGVYVAYWLQHMTE
jgi:cardiolipin synthase